VLVCFCVCVVMFVLMFVLIVDYNVFGERGYLWILAVVFL